MGNATAVRLAYDPEPPEVETVACAALLSLLLIAGAVGAVVARRRARPDALSDLDEEAEANRWVVRLGGSLSALDVRTLARADRTAVQALTDATERLGTARAQLAIAHSGVEYAQVKRTAAEGLQHVREARTALGLDSDQPAPGRGDAGVTIGVSSDRGERPSLPGGCGPAPQARQAETTSRALHTSSTPSAAARGPVVPERDTTARPVEPGAKPGTWAAPVCRAARS